MRASSAKPGGRAWFWRILAVLLTAALAWMGWVAIQLLPWKPLATELAFQAAAEARSRAAVTPPAPAVMEPVVTPPAPAEPTEATAIPAIETRAETPATVEAKTAAVPVVNDTLRLAFQLETPIAERPAAPRKREAPKPTSLKPAAAPAVMAAAPKAIDKRDRGRSAAESGESHFRRAALLLSHGRVSEAEDHLMSALRADPAHAPARQAYVALLLEQRRVDVAQKLLQEGLALNPAQPTFALALARIHAGQREYAAALEVLERAGAADGNADFQAMRGAVLQRLGRHAEAVDAYQNALRTGPQPATAWIGLGMSLESLGRKAEAVTAYRRALAAGPIALEARDYAESRARALE